MNKIHPEVEKRLPIVEAVVKLMHPFVEGAVHDLESGKVIAIYNNISKRKIGDKSPLEELHTPVEKFPDFFEPYYKDNWDGRKLKCTSITIRDENKKAIGLICFNYDTTFFKDINTVLGSFLHVETEAANPVELFGSDYKDIVKNYVNEYIRQNSTTIKNLTRKQKKEIIKKMYEKGVFNFKNSANYLADILEISRASVYNYLK